MDKFHYKYQRLELKQIYKFSIILYYVDIKLSCVYECVQAITHFVTLARSLHLS